MRSLLSRIQKLEAEIGLKDCECNEPEHRLVQIPVENDWSEERMQLADSNAWFLCAVHGHQPPRGLYRVYPDDVRL